MVGLYDDPFAYDGADFTTFLGPDQFATGSSPEDFHVHSATEPHFPAAVHAALKGPPHHHVPYLASPTDPLGPGSLEHALPRSAPPPTSYPIHRLQQQQQQQQQQQPGNGTNSGPPTANTTTTTANNNSTNSITANANNSNNPDELRALLRQAALERDEARMQLSTALNELYAARAMGKRLRAERDEARAQADFLGAERAKLRAAETRLRRERNEARLALLALKGPGTGGATAKGGAAGAGAGAVTGGGSGVGARGQGNRVGPGAGAGGMDSQGEDSGESPPMGMELMMGTE
ncbi:hypothetical protein C7999DRAFT_43952 [Corynascus novoguineensis]|uniref:Uncharacterized protein n=1 Tax=Corynascus novoguineensis TaxID=1126955 RepID=A0AAN7HJH5_9PEZI|nr:hypothetical protein C7999DRAFT_43952 [Corynascus novoguineensis]